MQKVFVCAGGSNMDISDVNECLRNNSIYNAKVISVTPFFEPVASPNTLHNGNYGVVIVIEADAHIC